MNSNKQIKFIVPSIAVIAIIGLGFSVFGTEKNEALTSVDSIPLSTKPVKNTPAYQARDTDFTVVKDKNDFVTSVDKRLLLIDGRNDLSAYDDETLLAAINEPLVWDFATEASTETLPLDDIEKEDGRTFFQANPVRIAVSIPGDILEISLPEFADSMDLEVVQVNTPSEGVISLSGEIQGTSGTFNMTQSNGVIAGHINTATNTYSFEIFGDTGWIHESGALFTGELPPVVHTDDHDHHDHATHSSLGDSGEHIIAKGSTDSGSSSDSEQTEVQE